MASGSGPTAVRSWSALAVLIVISLFALVDRQVFILLAEPIRLDLGLTDVQLGLLQGFGLSAFAALASLPIGLMVDKWDRRLVLCGCIAIWSGAVLACAWSWDFPSLLVASAIVGAGEAGVIPVAYALIPLLFAGPKRQLANSLYTLAGRLGLGVAMFACGMLITLVAWLAPSLPDALASQQQWRLVLVAAAGLAPLMMVLVLVIPRIDLVHHKAAEVSSIRRFVRQEWQSFLGFYGAMAAAMFGLTALTTWLPIATMRAFAVGPQAVASLFGTATLVATVVGLIGSMAIMRRTSSEQGAVVAVKTLMAAAAGAGIIAIAIPYATSATALVVLYTLHLSAASVGTMVYPTALQAMAPAHLRGRAVAIIGTVQFVASALAPLAVGILSTALDRGGARLIPAIIWLAVPAIGIASVLFRYTLSHFAQTVMHAASTNGLDNTVTT